MKEKLAHLPTQPGCYLMLNELGDVIYVGKAKNLKNRLKSYFTGSHNAKTTLLVSEIKDFNYIMTNSEQESLILEFNLIKQYNPRYNIRLMDDKTYPYIEITSEKDPMLIVSRYKEIDKSKKLFGPYPNVNSAKETLGLLQRLYPLRRCQPVAKKPCIYYHMGQCLGPCLHQGDIDYGPNIQAITKFLKGDTKEVLSLLIQKMQKASEASEYEKAIEYRDMIGHVKQTTEKQIISLNDFKDRDFISFYHDADDVAIHILNMRQGRILDAHQTVFSYVGDLMDAVLNYLSFYYQKVVMPEELIFDEQIPVEILDLYYDRRVHVPKKGDKKKLVDLCYKNAKNDLEHHHKIYQASFEKKQVLEQALETFIGKSTKYVEIFDNAQLFGLAPISGMVVYKDGRFEKKMYRKFHIRSANQDDYQAMREVLYRRYQRLLMEKAKLPDIICVDGGKGQVSQAVSILSELGLDMPILGLKKDKSHQLEAVVYNQHVHMLDKKSPLYLLLAKFSEEVHRFTVSFHRQTRSKKSYESELGNIEGLGPKRKQKLLKAFKSIDDIKTASNEELSKLGIPMAVIKALKEELI